MFFVPKFDVMFDRLRAKGEMPNLTEGLLSFSNILQTYGWLMLSREGGHPERVAAAIDGLAASRAESESGNQCRDTEYGLLHESSVVSVDGSRWVPPVTRPLDSTWPPGKLI